MQSFLAVHSRKKDGKCKYLKRSMKFATVSDEAFALLVLENIWSDMEKVNNECYQPKKRKKETMMRTTRTKHC